ncbi:MAG: NUDIX domain-containing protein [Marinoscillum sp.]
MKTVEVTVGAVIFNPDQEVLLCKSAKWNNQYVIPGGHVEYGEQLEDAIKREVKEETGLTITNLRIASLQESVNSEHFHERRHMLFIDYFCDTDSSEVVLKDEADEYQWVVLDKVLSYDLGGFLPDLFREILKKPSEHEHQVLYGYVG